MVRWFQSSLPFNADPGDQISPKSKREKNALVSDYDHSKLHTLQVVRRRTVFWRKIRGLDKGRDGKEPRRG